MTLDFSRCRYVWVPDDSKDEGGFWSPPPLHVCFGVEQIVSHPFFFLGDDMGLMKTAQSIISAQMLHEMGVIDRVIVIAPAAVRPKVWFDEDLGQLREQLWLDKRHLVSEYHKKIKQWALGPEDAKELRWIITNYEYLRGEHYKTLLSYCGPKTMLILDESNSVRGPSSAQTAACMKLRYKTNKKGNVRWGVERCGRILLLNGTPIAESPMDMFSQCNLMHPKVLDCRYKSEFEARYATKTIVRGREGDAVMNPRTGKPLEVVDGWTNLDDLQRRVAPYMLRREAKDVGIDFALPPVCLEVRLTKETWKVYKNMRDELVVWLESNVATAATAAVKTIRLAQITSGFLGGVEDSNLGTLWSGTPASPDAFEALGALAEMIEPDSMYTRADIVKAQTETVPGVTAFDKMALDGVQEIGREKLDFALGWQAELLRKNPNAKLLTWCRFVPELRRYLSEVKKTFNHPVGALCGQSIFPSGKLKEEREEALRMLHPKTAPQGPVTVGATQGTGALGLNLTACRTVLDMSFDFSPWKKKQGDARVNRPGQTGPVSFFYLVAVGPDGQKTIDHHIVMTRLGKMNINEWTIKAWVRALKEE